MSLLFRGGAYEQQRRDWLAGGLGFEPRLTESESAVLPLNYPPIGKAIVECNLGRSRRLVSLLASARGSNADTSRTSCASFQAATAQTPLTPCVGPTCRMPRWQSPPAHRRRRREIPRAGTHDRGTARRSRAPPCRRYESRW